MGHPSSWKGRSFIRLKDPLLEACARALLRLEVNDTDDCWIHPGNKDGNGYSCTKLRSPRRDAKVHRVVYEVLIGPIPDGLTLDHLCRNRACANPSHLEPVTLKENILRGNSSFAQKARQTHCKYGHEFSPENTRISKKGTRICRACSNRKSTP